jgi:hypothetical protein
MQSRLQQAFAKIAYAVTKEDVKAQDICILFRFIRC